MLGNSTTVENLYSLNEASIADGYVRSFPCCWRSGLTKLTAMHAQDFIASWLMNNLPAPIAQQAFASFDGHDDVASFAVLLLRAL